MAKFRSGLCGAVALLGAVCLPIAAADAATVTETYDFTASGFQAGSPVNPWTGSFTITFNPALSGPVGPLALDAFSSNLPASYGTFEYSQFDQFPIIGTNCGADGGCSVVAGTDEAFLGFTLDPSGVLTLNSAVITSTNFSGFFEATSFSATPAPTTPLPAALPLFATGLGALGLLGWFRKRKARVSLLGAA